MNDERKAWVALAWADGVGPAMFARLIAAFETAGDVLDAALAGILVESLREREAEARGEPPPDLPAALAAAIAVAAREAGDYDRILARLGVTAMTWRDMDYPERLRGLDEAPAVLFVRGSREALSMARSLAVVGTRRPTPAGRSFAAAVGAAIASCGAAVVSGLAFGIDAAAHAAAVEVGGVTVAVLGSGQATLTPAAHRHLAESIVASGGALVSELRADARPTKGTYPRRNRLIAGLAEAVIVVEAPARSGALNTAHWAATFGRDLHVVPGRPWEPTTAGCVALLHDVPGCRPIVDVPTLLDDLVLLNRSAPATPGRPSMQAVLQGLSTTEAALARQLRRGPASPDRLAQLCSLPVEQVAGGLSLLELRGYAWSSGSLYLAGGALRDAR
jgi:DNA processing protein